MTGTKPWRGGATLQLMGVYGVLILGLNVAATGAGLGVVRSGRFRVSELDRDVDNDLWCRAGSDGLWRMLPNLHTREREKKYNKIQSSNG